MIKCLRAHKKNRLKFSFEIFDAIEHVDVDEKVERSSNSPKEPFASRILVCSTVNEFNMAFPTNTAGAMQSDR